MKYRNRMRPERRAEIIELVKEGLVCLLAFVEIAAVGFILILMGGA